MATPIWTKDVDMQPLLAYTGRAYQLHDRVSMLHRL